MWWTGSRYRPRIETFHYLHQFHRLCRLLHRSHPKRGAISGTHPLGNWILNPPKLYPRFTSGMYRNRYVHRIVWELVAGRQLPDGWHVHHQDFDRLNFAPCNLIAMPACFNVVGNSGLRCPYTGKYLALAEWEHRFGYAPGAYAVD
jgi:hypothetical protein